MSGAASSAVVVTIAPRLVTAAAAAEMLGIGRTKVYELANRGDLEKVHIDASALITVESIDLLVERLRKEEADR